MPQAANPLPEEGADGARLSGEASVCAPLAGFGALLMCSVEVSWPRQDESHLFCT